MKGYSYLAIPCIALAAAVVQASVQPVQAFALPSKASQQTPIGKNRAHASSSSLAAASVAASDGDIPRGGNGGGSSSFEGGQATIPNEVFNLVKSIVGSGVLSLPYGVAAFGNAPSALIPAVAITTIMGGLSAYTFGMIARVCRETNTMSYADAWDASVGKRTAPLIAFSCFFDCFAGALSYSMILADTAVNLFKASGIAVGRTPALLTITTFILLPLCLMKNLNSLAPFSLVGIISMLYITLAMGVRWLGSAYAPGGTYFASQLVEPVFGAAGAKSALSFKVLILTCMLTNAYIAHFNAPKFLAELKDNTMGRFNKVIAWSFGISIALYAAATSFGFLTFGSVSNGFILNNYSVKDKLMSLASIAVTISITTSYPLIFVGARDGMLDLFRIPQEKRDNSILNKVTLGILGAATLLASQLTDLGMVASVGGATFGTALVFVYPAIMFLKQQKGKRTAETIPAALIGCLGVVMGVIGTYFSLSGVEL
mmetsp:Transcript_20431/g.26341  ORF Transcript_20431/g.26341 Transcript_20431/m.26341 type:complete len:486 (+) Transcript_20431:248-1705(+)|eukprot:CAMPEP_0198146434 /NCGR_PEP_ID=MMETSP1443-20131203/29531_1 /TAXON_ID=186043 /ORGANISM="Entomoneis sp., Strain CCMP2396" /LENGTH=485 /DNA_ID=CAMNT_0043810411 /DNA_START=225 /DNA_END=1682 /DNA_ORIENTATION=-